MFSTLQMPAHTFNQQIHYTPRVSSPLSSSPLRSSPPLSAHSINVPARSPNFHTMSPTPSKPSTSKQALSSPSSRGSAYSKRATKANPLIHGRSSGPDGRETRRKLFLKKVKEDSEDARWKARGGEDEMMRTIWMAEQRRREERQAREALRFTEEVDEDMAVAGEGSSLEEIMAEEVAAKEEEELEALLGSMPQEQDAHASHWEIKDTEEGRLVPGTPRLSAQLQPPDTPYGSDDEEYDHIFMDVILEEVRRLGSQQGRTDADQDMMDLS